MKIFGKSGTIPVYADPLMSLQRNAAELLQFITCSYVNDTLNSNQSRAGSISSNYEGNHHENPFDSSGVPVRIRCHF